MKNAGYMICTQEKLRTINVVPTSGSFSSATTSQLHATPTVADGRSDGNRLVGLFFGASAHLLAHHELFAPAIQLLLPPAPLGGVHVSPPLPDASTMSKSQL